MEKKVNHLVGSIICGILTAFGIVAGVISLIGGSGGIWTVNDILLLVLSVLIGYYAFAGYKKPHGNLLKYIILLYTVNILLGLRATVQLGQVGVVTLNAISLNAFRIGLLCYCAGRLAKVKENLIIMIVETVIGAGTSIWGAISGYAGIGYFTY